VFTITLFGCSPAGQIFEEAMNTFENVSMPLPPELSQAAKLSLLNNATAKGITAIADAYVFERDLGDYGGFHCRI
jgi:hypothetical protein